MVATIALTLSAASARGSAEENAGPPTKLVWATERVLKVPESVCHDPVRDVLYVANIGGQPTDKDGNGFIARLSLAGEVLELEWATGLDAPKGMAVVDSTLYVTDIDRVVSIAIPSGEIVMSLAVDGARFLNDTTADREGTVYVSDMTTGKVHRLVRGAVETWLTGLKRPNGLLAERDRLLVGTQDRLLGADYASGEISVVAAGTGGIDGVAPAPGGGYLISDWAGAVRRVAPDGELALLFDTSADEIQAADITCVVEKRLLLVPTFFDNRVMAYALE
jgi:hypothetical protein